MQAEWQTVQTLIRAFWLGSTLFAQICLSKHFGSFWYMQTRVCFSMIFLYCLPFLRHLLDALLYGKIIHFKFTVIILSFRTDIPGQTVQTKIWLLFEEQSDQGLHCLQFHLHLLEALQYGKASCSNFRVITTNFSYVQIFRIFTVE